MLALVLVLASSSNKPKKINKTKLAKNLGIGRSSIYYKLKLPAKDLVLKKQIEEVLAENKAYGHKRIAIDLRINKKRVLSADQKSKYFC